MADEFPFRDADMPDNRAPSGGAQTPKPIPYSPPVGPSNINDSQSPGLHGTNHGNSVNQGRH